MSLSDFAADIAAGQDRDRSTSRRRCRRNSRARAAARVRPMRAVPPGGSFPLRRARPRLVLEQLFLLRAHRHAFRRADPLDLRQGPAEQQHRHDPARKLHRARLRDRRRARQVAANHDFILTRACYEAWEAKHGQIPAGAWVLLRTDWSKRSWRRTTPTCARTAPTRPAPTPTRCASSSRSATSTASASRPSTPTPARPSLHAALSLALLHARQGSLRPAMPEQSRPAAADRRAHHQPAAEDQGRLRQPAAGPSPRFSVAAR